jgi:hypothetical protein
MARKTLSQESVFTLTKEIVKIQNQFVTTDNLLTVDVKFEIPAGMHGLLNRWWANVSQYYPVTADYVVSGQSYTLTDLDPFARHPAPAQTLPNDSYLGDYVLALISNDGNVVLRALTICPEIKLKDYVNNKIAPSIPLVWKHFDDNNIWASTSGETELTSEVDLKNGYYAQGFNWRVNQIPIGVTEFGNLIYWHRLVDADHRFKKYATLLPPSDEDIDFVSRSPFNASTRGVIGTAEIGIRHDSHGYAPFVYTNNTSGVALPYEDCPILRYIVIYRKDDL